MRVGLLILLMVAVDCAPPDDRENRPASAVQPAVGVNRFSRSRSANSALDSVTGSSASVEEPDATPRLKPTVRLVDYGVRDLSDTVAKVEVTLGGAVDTIPRVLASLRPITTDDGIIHGIAMTGESFVSSGYDYNARTRKLTRFPLPADLNTSYQNIKLNEDAKFFGYIAHIESGQTWAVVRRWPDMVVVARTQPSDLYPSEGTDDERVEWPGAYQFQFQYRISSGSYIVVDGDAQQRTMKVDTVAPPT
jgi:hypothetical protein